MKVTPQPGDTIITDNGQAFTCCTAQHLIDQYGLPPGNLEGDRLYGYRASGSVLGFAWQDWPLAEFQSQPSHAYAIKKVIIAHINKPKLKGLQDRDNLIAHLQTLPKAFVIAEDGTIHP